MILLWRQVFPTGIAVPEFQAKIPIEMRTFELIYTQCTSNPLLEGRPVFPHRHRFSLLQSALTTINESFYWKSNFVLNKKIGKVLSKTELTF